MELETILIVGSDEATREDIAAPLTTSRKFKDISVDEFCDAQAQQLSDTIKF